jgi:hypothetical protein
VSSMHHCVWPGGTGAPVMMRAVVPAFLACAEAWSSRRLRRIDAITRARPALSCCTLLHGTSDQRSRPCLHCPRWQCNRACNTARQ